MLVAGLSAIIVICCVAVFFLLRGHRVDRYEQHARSVMAGDRNTTLYEMPLGPQGVRQKFKHFFTFGKKRDGWIRANSGEEDEWDASDRLVQHHARDDSQWVAETGMFHDPTSQRGRGPSRVERSQTSDSIELTVPSPPPPLPQSPYTAANGPPQHGFFDPYSSSPQPPELRRIPSSSAEIETYDTEGPRAPSASSTDGASAAPKFESGTKFREALAF